MSAIDIETIFGQKIKDTFTSNSYKHIEVYERGFNVTKSIPTDAILFIGINPSYNDKNAHEKDLFYDPATNGHSYFSKFKTAAGDEVDWGHIDLLFFRETKQKRIDEILKKKQNGVSFIWEQLQISKEILETVRPKVIVVCNTKAKHFLGYDEHEGKHIWMGYKFSFDDSIGTYRITNENSNLRNTPVFFTSMLTGQRALDNGSFRRLEWHIKQVVNKS